MAIETSVDRINKVNDFETFVVSLAREAASDARSADKKARLAQQKLALAIMVAIDHNLVEEHDRHMTRADAVNCGMQVYKNVDAPKWYSAKEHVDQDATQWATCIAHTVYPKPSSLPEQVNRNELSAKATADFEAWKSNLQTAKRVARFTFLLCALDIHLDAWNETRGFIVHSSRFVSPTVTLNGKHHGDYELVTNQDVYMTPGQYGMVKVAVRVNLGADGSKDVTFNATMQQLEKANTQNKSKSKASELSVALQGIATHLKPDSKLTVGQREMLDKALAQIIAWKEAHKAADDLAKDATERNAKSA